LIYVLILKKKQFSSANSIKKIIDLSISPNPYEKNQPHSLWEKSLQKMCARLATIRQVSGAVEN
jgi:hypothetical protein